MSKSSRNYHSERQVIFRIAEIHYSVVKRLGLWTHLPIREDCPSATLQNRVPTSGCAYRMQIINLPPHKTQAFGRDLLLQRKSRKHCRTFVLYGSSCGISHKRHFTPSTADGWLFANITYNLTRHRHICPLSVTHSLVSRMLFCSTIF